MKTYKLVLGATMFALSLAISGGSLSASSTTLFSDSFESGNFANWTTVDKGPDKWAVLPGLIIKAQDGKRDAEVSRAFRRPTTDWKLSKATSTSGHNNINLSFYYLIPRAGNLESNDHLLVEWFDGSNWQQIADITNTNTGIINRDSWKLASYNLPAEAGNNPAFAFRLVAKFSPNSKGLDNLDTFIVDNVVLSGEKIVSVPSTLTIINNIMNDDSGGTLGPKDFTITIATVNGTSTLTNVDGNGTTTLVVPGQYSIDSSYQADPYVQGYQKTLSADCVGLIMAGENKVCTITNNDESGHLIMIKHVINDDGGMMVADQFQLNVHSPLHSAYYSMAGHEYNPNHPAIMDIFPGPYVADEDNQFAHLYVKTKSADCEGSIKAGEFKTCLITNDDIAQNIVDLIPPQILQAYDTETTSTTTVITYGTDEPTTGLLTLKIGPFGVDSVGRDLVSHNSADGLTHSVYIDNLDPGTEYYVRIVAQDAQGNKSTVYYNFATKGE